MEPIGDSIGTYQVLEPIASGAMATVYKGYQPGTERTVAIKVILPNFSLDDLYIKRFEREARLVANLEHPRIVPLYDFGKDKGRLYIIMRYLEGGSLDTWLEEEALPIQNILQIATQVSDGLGYAHANEVIHRDVKPANVMFDSVGYAYISDFGLAKNIHSKTNLTGDGLLGTPEYMSPEQGMGDPVDHRTDIYSLGIMLYEMAVGSRPFESEKPMSLVNMHIDKPLPTPTLQNPDLDPRLEEIILKACAKKPGDRYQTCEEFSEALMTLHTEL